VPHTGKAVDGFWPRVVQACENNLPGISKIKKVNIGISFSSIIM
jgi:hypothetical protein